MVTPIQGDIVWKMEKLNPMSPKKDGSAEAYLHKIGKTPEQFMCDTLMITSAAKHGTCAVCLQPQKTTKLSRIKQNGIFNDIHICTACINVFVEYNPNSVFDLERK